MPPAFSSRHWGFEMGVAKKICKIWTFDEDELLRSLHGETSLAKIAAELGRPLPSIRGRITRLGIAKKPHWSLEEVDYLREAYATVGEAGVLHLDSIAERLGRHKTNVCRKAKELGFGTNQRRKIVELRKDRPKFTCDIERRAAASRRAKEWIAKNGHPKGFQGHRHTLQARQRISSASKAFHLITTPERKEEIMAKMLKTRAANGFAPPSIQRGTWQAGWREIGGTRNYYRSRWEANYACYLQWLKERGDIADWKHEPETFWFEAVRRGVRSYKPDFRVWENNGFSCLHEVKGWMDSRSRTTLSRMKKYYPAEKIILIDGPQYRAIRLKAMHLVPGWEDSPRDSYA